MIQNRHKRAWLMIAAIAIGIALLLLLVPHAHSVDNGGWLAILPPLFLGILSPLTFFPSSRDDYSGRTPEAPSIPAAFQRPPPFLLG
ncbi:MAG TPA: hypothetical protein VMV57_14830 [Terracidiphilus sp.]|nr:hypothetical protein [Terracidiphilus sp.]